MVKNWKTTVIGILTGASIGINAIVNAYQAGTFNSNSIGQLILALAFVLMGAYAKDHDVTGR